MSIDGATEFSTVKGHTVTKEYSVDAMVVDDGEHSLGKQQFLGAINYS